MCFNTVVEICSCDKEIVEVVTCRLKVLTSVLGKRRSSNQLMLTARIYVDTSYYF